MLHARRLVLAAMATLLLGACSAGGLATTPSAPVAAPTAPANAASEPSGAPVATPSGQATAPSAEATLPEAIERTGQTASYALRYSLSATAAPGGLEQPLVAYELTARGDNLRLSSRGAALTTAGGDPARTTETLRIGGSTYARGPLPLPGAADAGWYNLGDAPLPIGNAGDLGALLNTLSEPVELASFRAAGAESLEGQACTIYQAEREAAQAALEAAVRRGPAGDARLLATELAADELSQAEMRIWSCADGYVRRVRVVIEGYSAAEPTKRVAAGVNLEIGQLDAPVELEAPVEARTLAATRAFGDATASSGGNVRALPPDGQPLDQVNVGETVQLFGRTAARDWYLVVTPRGVAGWTSATLLAIEPAVEAALPALDAFSTAPSAGAAVVSSSGSQPSAEPVTPEGTVAPLDDDTTTPVLDTSATTTSTVATTPTGGTATTTPTGGTAAPTTTVTATP